MMTDLGLKMAVRAWTDSRATMGICGRRGLGKLRHIDTQCLWIQQKVRRKGIELRKILGEMNPADLFTKHLPGEDKVKSLVKLLSCEFRGGRAASAPKLKNGADGPIQELLTAENEYFIQHEDKTFPAVEYEGEFVVEAYAHTHDVLPHLHREIDSLFPRAVAKEEEEEGEDVSPCGFEQRGETLGKAVPKTKTAPTTTTTTTKTATTTAATTTTTTVDNGGKRASGGNLGATGTSEVVRPEKS